LIDNEEMIGHGCRWELNTHQQRRSTLMRPLMQCVKVFTMIDNVRIAARNRETFLEVVRCFLRRCQAAGVRLNDLDWSMAGSCAGTLTTPIAAMSERQWRETDEGLTHRRYRRYRRYRRIVTSSLEMARWSAIAFHVHGEENPADAPSRATGTWPFITATDLVTT
jgi:hypothetical protein